MSKVDWRSLERHIPHRVQINNNRFYEVVEVQDFPDGNTDGECRYDQNQIVLLKDLTPKSKVSCYIHELIHATSDEFDANLTENQVLALEKALYYWLKKGNIFNAK